MFWTVTLIERDPRITPALGYGCPATAYKQPLNVNDRQKKLKPLAELVLIGEIVTQSKFAANAAGRLAESSDQIEVWGSIQSIMVAAGNVSKILWPVGKQYKERGKQLRDLIGIDVDNLLSDRTFRNHFEHYDERIEDWFDGNDSAVYTDQSIDPLERSPFGLPRFAHRSYNPVSQVLRFRDESIDLAAVLAALAEIREKCRFLALP